MWTNFMQLLKPPKFIDEDQTRAAEILHVILLTLFIVLGILAFFTDHPVTVFVTAGMSLSFLGLWAIMRRGFVYLASWCLMGFLVMGITLIVYFNGSIRIPAASGFVACIVVAGLTLGNRVTIGSAIIISGILLVLYLAEGAGKLPPVYYQSTGFLQWATYAGIMCITAVLLMLARNSILNALALARRNEAALAERNQELQVEIAERHQVEHALRESEGRYRTLVSTSPDGIAQTDIHGNIIYASPQLLSLLRLESPEGILGTNVIEWLAPEDRQRALENVQLVMGGAPSTYNKYSFLLKDGACFDGEVSSAAWQDADGQLNGMISIVRDVTERVRAEVSLNEYRERLEELVEERTAQLTAINQELESFSYSVAHDLRAPLRVISGFSNILLEDHASQIDSEVQSYLNQIIASGQRMSRLIDALLGLSHLTRRDISREEIDLGAMAHTILDELRQREPAREVDMHIAEGLIVQADRHLMHLVLENLLGNAWKFTANSPQARIEVGRQDGDKAAYFVRDNGAGFNMDNSGKLFGPFQRLHTEKEFPGTGIGLATVKRIIHRHNGEVWARGEVNKGATFYFTLP
ncbi:MAG: PAS domain S-box protein [Chloroflexi bacterium]|nr:PAS domain S-box protein [Chloroflexota bacterium]